MNETRPRCWFCNEAILPGDETIVARELGVTVHRDCYRDVRDGVSIDRLRRRAG